MPKSRLSKTLQYNVLVILYWYVYCKHTHQTGSMKQEAESLRPCGNCSIIWKRRVISYSSPHRFKRVPLRHGSIATLLVPRRYIALWIAVSHRLNATSPIAVTIRSERAMANPPSAQNNETDASNLQNVATAYPPNQSGLAKRLPMLISTILLLTYLIYQRLNRTQSETQSASSSALRTSTDAVSPTAFGNNSRIAVCYTGHVGTFSDVYQQNAEAFQKVTKTPVANFFVIDLEDDYKDGRTNTHYKQSHEIGTLQPMFDDLSARGIETYSSEGAIKKRAGDDCIGEHAPIQDDGGHFSHAFSTLHASARCYDLVKSDEEENGMRYDWVIRLRLDMEIAVSLPPADVQPRVHLSGMAIALLPRSLCDAYFSAVDAFDNRFCAEVKEVDNQSCRNYSYEPNSPECWLIKWLKLKDIVPSNGVYVNRRIIYPTS